ncbi:MAG: hypothetical protein JNN05_11770, partial [Candidatus Omnitrophica bacterium]|nr:hypothetical protein [Candidatus Omnitrophota bacterium]
EGYRLWGDALWERMNGFWAVALFDMQSRQLILSRDRVGVAPLYYRETDDGFYFASCLQSLINIDPNGLSINHDVVDGFIETGFKDYDQTTYYEQIRSVAARSVVALGPNQWSLNDGRTKVYWDFPQKRLTRHEISFPQAVDKFRKIFFDAVHLRLRSDVKVAFELSGGLDSSSVVAAAAILQKSNITTYTAKIKDADEEPYARAMLEKYKINYRVLEHLESDFVKDYQSFSSVMEEPFDNPNAYTHYRMLLAMKKEGVHVVVTGAGGDEVLAGYEASFWPKAYEELRRAGGASYLRADWYEFCRRFKTIPRARKTLSHYLFDSMKRLSVSKENPVPLDSSGGTTAAKYQRQYHRLSFHEQCLFHFNVALLPYYMRSSDHFTMGIPVEHRFPMLDYRMIELGLTLPTDYLFCNGWTKFILRKAMEPYLPKDIVWRRQKMGFTFPYKTFFEAKRDSFEHAFSSVTDARLRLKRQGGFDELLNADAQKLWRLLSTAIWWTRTKQGIAQS